MKKLISAILSIFVVAVAGAQNYPVTQNLGNTPTTLVTTNSIKANQGIILGSFADTTAANVLPYLKNYTGAAIWSTSDSSIYVRLKTATSAFWFKIGGAGGGATGSYWSFTGNVFPVIQAGFGLGTNDETNLPIKTNNITRLTIPYTGLAYMSASTDSIIVRDASGNVGLIPKSGGGVVSAWELTGNSGTSVGTNFIGTTDSMALLLKVNNRTAGFFSRAGMSSVGPYINYSGSFIALGQMAGNTPITSILSGNQTAGAGNLVIGNGAGQYLGASYDTTNSIALTSNANILIGTGSGQFIQRRNFIDGLGRNVFISESSCFWCTTPGENVGLGYAVMETGTRPLKNVAIGSNALRTANSASYETAVGAYSLHYSGCVIGSVTINSSSSDWTTATVTFSAPYNYGSAGACYVTATGTAVISGGQIIGVTITNPGCGYTNSTTTMYTGLTHYYPTVTITGDGSSVSASVNVLCGTNTTAVGQASAWLTRAQQYMTYLGESVEPSVRYWDAYGGAIGYNAGVHSSISPLQKLTNSWAFGTRAKVSTDRTFTIGAPVGDTTLKVIINNHTGDSTLSVYGGGIYTSGGLRFVNPASGIPAGAKRLLWATDGTVYISDTTSGGGAVPISSLTAATGTNTINNGAHRQEWQWNSLTSGAALTLSSSSVQTGSLLRLIGTQNNPGSADDSGMLYVSSVGITGPGSSTTYGIRSLVDRNGSGAFNIAGYFEAVNGSTNYAAKFTRGRVSFGTSGTESARIEINGGTSGIVTIQPAAAAGTYTLTLPTTDGASGEFLQTDGSGALTWAAASGGTPAGNFGNLQINRNGAFATPGSDSLDYENSTGLTVKNDINVSGTGKAFIGRWKARVDSTTSSATPTINTDNIDIYKLTAQAADITSFTTNLSGSPYDGDILEIVITGTATRAITWGASFVSTTVTLPTTTSGTTTLTVILQYFKSSSYGNNKWHCVNYF